MRENRWLNQEGGFALIEVLAALALLLLVAIPMLDFSATTGGTVPFQRQAALNAATSKVESLQSQAYRTTSWPANGSDPPLPVGAYSYDVSWVVAPYTPANNDNSTETSKLRTATVTVTCLNCPRPMTPVQVVAIISKICTAASAC